MKNRIFMVVFSISFLCLFLNSNAIVQMIGNRIISAKVLQEAELKDMLKDIKEKKKKRKKEAQTIPLEFNNCPVTYDRVTNTIYIPQRIDEKQWEGKLSSEDSKIYVKDDAYFQNKERAISEGHEFELFLVEDDSYYTYQLVFTGMPIMNLFAKSSFMEGDTEVKQGIVQVYDQYHTSTQFQSADCSYNVRGGSSLHYPKSNYKLNLGNRKLSFLGLRKDDDWILNSLYDDAGLIHNKISTQVWNRIAASNDVKNDEGITVEYIEVFIDNEYHGVYALTERIDEKELSLGKNDILYKCRAERIPEEHNYSNEDTDDMRPIFLLKYPKQPGEQDWEPLKQWVDYFLKEEFTEFWQGEELLCMENSVDFNLFCLLIAGRDNLRKNVFFAAEYQSDGTYEFKKIPWDLNATWGNPWVDIEECNYTQYDPNYYKEVRTWVSDMSTLYYYDEAQISTLLYERWKELREGGIITTESLCALFDKQFAYLHSSGAYTRNYERWPNGSEYWQDEYLYEYTENRIQFLDWYLEQLYLDNTTGIFYNNANYADEFDARYYWETNYDTLSQLYDFDSQVLLEHYILYGKPFGLKGRKD